MIVGLRLSTEELMLLNCGVGEDTSEPLKLCGSQKTVENSSGDGNFRPPDLPLKSVCTSRRNS